VGAPVPFRTKKGEEWSPWKAIIPGKGLTELAPSDATKEEADKALAPMITSMPTPVQKKSGNLIDSLMNTGKTAQQDSLPFTDSTNSTTKPTSGTDKPKTGELRKEGLAELSAAKVEKFRKIIAGSLASGNVSLDRALVSIFRDKVPVLPPESYMLLSSGWELACEQYFVNGVPPAWIIILLGNAMVVTGLYEKSELKQKPKEEDDGKSTANPGNGAQTHKQN
jgi:hypothetical protein